VIEVARTKKNLKQKRKAFIFVEGETEEVYFSHLKQNLRLSAIRIKARILNNSGKTYLDKAKTIMKNDINYRRDNDTDVYLVFDKDDISKEDFNKLLNKAKRENIEVGFSNEAFEVFLLAHYEKCGKKSLTKSDLKNKLTDHLNQEYIKANDSQISKIVKLHEIAIENTLEICECNYDKQSTNIGSIIKKIKNS